MLAVDFDKSYEVLPLGALVQSPEAAANTLVSALRPDIEELLVAAAVITHPYQPSNRVRVSDMEDILAAASIGEY